MTGVVGTLRSVARFGPVELRPAKRRLQRAADVADLRRIARRRLPRGIFDYIDGAAEDERTCRRNVAAFEELELVPNVLRDVSTIDTTTTLLGRTLPFPLVLAPTGFTRIADSEGELAVARSAARHGLPYALSTLSTRSIEEVAAVSDGPKWFQAYVWRDRGLVADMVARAAAEDYEALVITVDTAVFGRRERDVRRGYTLPPKLGPGTIVDGVLHPAWTRAFLTGGPITFANVDTDELSGSGSAVVLADYINQQFDPALSWDDISWFRDRWAGPIVLKGIQSVSDAERAVEAGVEGIALSNHGGRQLDGAPAAIDLVEPVAQAVGGSVAIICDGGVRRGSDVVKALALGADACSIGRAYLYALGAAGEPGVDWVLDQFLAGMRRTMALCGRRSLAEIDRGLVRRRRSGRGPDGRAAAP